jgi:hypothetical protein
MNFLSSIRADLVEKRLLPVAIALAAVAVVVPVGAGLLSSSSSSPVVGPPAAVTPPPGAPSPAKALDAVAGPSTPAAKVYKGRELDPFRLSASAVKAQAAAAAKTGSTTVVKTAATTPVATTKTSTTPTTKVTTPKVTTTPKTTPAPKTTPTPTTPVATPSPLAQLAKLTSRQSYSVAMNVVDATGARTLANAVRLSPLPSASNPLVEYLGVLRSGRGASFLVNPGTVAQGPGLCLPSGSDCQLLVLKPGQIEALGVHTSGAPVMQASIAVSDWHVVRHSSVAAARRARAQVVPQGRTLVTQSTQPALTDLVYTVTQGAVSVIPSIVSALPSALAKLLGG